MGKRKRNLKLPNGFGSIIYLGENRRQPYAARITKGWSSNGKQLYEYIGYGEKWENAYDILSSYHGNPYNTDNKDITLGEVYDMLEPIMRNNIGVKGMSKSNYVNLTSAYRNYLLDSLGKEKVLNIKKKQIKDIIRESNLRHTGRGYIKNIWTRIIEFCNDELELKIDTNIYNLDIGEKEKSDKHIPFTTKEILIISELAHSNDTAKLVMIYMYTGLRPSELLLIDKNNVFLEKNYMIGGIKTAAGQNRPIIIHSKVKDYIEYFYTKSTGNCLVMNEITTDRMTYDTYQDRFDKLMKELSIKHAPGDTRTTFASQCDRIGIPLAIIKRLMGHSLSNDVTNDVYIRKTIEELREWVERIKY